MRSKLHSYMGFAKKSRNLIMGYNTCLFAMNKKKVKLLIIAEDTSEKAGTGGRSIFGITDQNFAQVILKEIDKDG